MFCFCGVFFPQFSAVSLSEKATVKCRVWILPYKLFLKWRCLSIKCISAANMNMPGNNNDNKKKSQQILIIMSYVRIL